MKAWDRHSTFVVLALVLASFVARDAAAQLDDGNKADARAAYDGAALAHDRGDFVVAAREFARADELAPNDVALAQAIESATRAGTAALGMNLVERAHARTPGDSELIARADEAALVLSSLASKIVISCDGCKTQIDGVVATRILWVEPGTHVVEMRRGDHVDRIEIHAVAGATIEATPPPIAVAPPPVAEPVKSAPPKSESRTGWSPLVFWGAAGVTAIAGGITVASAIATVNDHTTFEEHPTTSAASAGTAAQLRTNVFLGITGVAAVSTAVIGLVFVRWSDPKMSSDVGLRVGPSSVSVGGHFE